MSVLEALPEDVRRELRVEWLRDLLLSRTLWRWPLLP